MVKNLTANTGDVKRLGFDRWVAKMPWNRKCNPRPKTKKKWLQDDRWVAITIKSNLIPARWVIKITHPSLFSRTWFPSLIDDWPLLPVSQVFFQRYAERNEMCMLNTFAQSCLTLCDPMGCSPPGSSVQRILQARILEWIAIFSFRLSSQPRDGTPTFWNLCLLPSRRILYHWVTWEAPFQRIPYTWKCGMWNVQIFSF